MKGSAQLIWRGALGGTIGAPMFLIALMLHELFRMGNVAYGGALAIMALPQFILIGIIFGAVIGGIIWVLVARPTTGTLPTTIRAIIGASFVLVVLLILQLVRHGENDGLIPPTPMEAFMNLLMYVGAFGVLPGVTARPRMLQVKENRSPLNCSVSPLNLHLNGMSFRTLVSSKPVLISFVLTPICLLIAAMSGEVGNGGHSRAIVLFPYAVLSTELDHFFNATIVMILLAVVQIPLYGLVLSIAVKRRKIAWAAPSLLALHTLAALIALLRWT